MSYASRFGGKRWRHDPAATGIFIHGGTCCAGPFYDKGCANRFSLTLPTSNPAGEDITYSRSIETLTKQPTFFRAVAYALAVRERDPALKDCPIYACTDLHMEDRSSGTTKVQFIA